MAQLSSQAAGLLLTATASGVDIRRDESGNLRFRPSTIAADLLAQLRAAKPELLALLDDGVQARRDAFAEQLAVTTAPRVPAFVFRFGVSYQQGICFSCGDSLPEDRYGRCWRCSLAWRLAARVQMAAAAHFDEAKVI